jgi:hypothetical protein
MDIVIEQYSVDGFDDPTVILQAGDAAFSGYRLDLRQWRYFRIGKTNFDRRELIKDIEESGWNT